MRILVNIWRHRFIRMKTMTYKQHTEDDKIRLSKILKSKKMSSLTVNDLQIEGILRLISYDRIYNTLMSKDVRRIFGFITNGVEYSYVSRTLRLKKLGNITASKYSKILRYGKRANEVFAGYVKIQGYTNTLEYKQKKHGFTEQDFKKYNKDRAVTKENLIKKHGEEYGTLKWNSYVELQRYAGSSLQYFKDKYGDEVGLKKYKDVCYKKGHTVDSIIKRSGVTYDEAVIELERLMTNLKPGVSNKANELFCTIYDNLNEEDKKHCYFQKLNNEFGKYDHQNKCYRKYDFCLTNKKIIIEYNGDYWHANPKFYKINDDVYLKGAKKVVKAKEIWEKDEHKKRIVEQSGFIVIYVWEHDYLNTKDDIIARIINIIKGI